MEWRHGDCELVNLTCEDLPRVLALETLCFSHPWTEEQYRLALKERLFRVVGLRRAGELVAYCSFYHAAGEMEILNLATDPAHRRQGLARLLLRTVLRAGRQWGMERVLLEVRVSNRAARRLYHGLGFRRVGARLNYYPDNGEDALVLALVLAPDMAPELARDMPAALHEDAAAAPPESPLFPSLD